MITDEERREIAEELRTRCDCNGFDQCDECQELSLRLFSDTQALCQLEGGCTTRWEELADLIDRGECENVYDENEMGACDNGFECSVCGCRVEDEDHYHVSGTWNFCPQCGRKVVNHAH